MSRSLRLFLRDLKRWLLKPLLKNPYIAKAHYFKQLERKILKYKAPPLLIYQMGKVGSRTVKDSLRALNSNMPIFYVHFMAPESVSKAEKKYGKYSGRQRAQRLKRVWQAQYVFKQMTGCLNGRKWNIVTLTRDPISRNISAFFEGLQAQSLDADQQRFRLRSNIHDFEIVVNVDEMDNLAELFFEKFPHDSPLEFFDKELKDVLGVDVFASDFPKSQGYKIYRDKHVDVLLIRLEDLDNCARDALKEFIDIDEFNLIYSNIANDKDYATIYKKFKDSIVLPQAYVERMYTSKYMQHFYSEEEITKFKMKWHISES